MSFNQFDKILDIEDLDSVQEFCEETLSEQEISRITGLKEMNRFQYSFDFSEKDLDLFFDVTD